MDSLLAWLTSLPIGTLYVALAAVAAIENVFPPIPADTVVALGSFLAARGKGSVIAAFAVSWGPVVWVMLGDKGPQAQGRLEKLYGRYGVIALFASRFIPGIRALVPPFAGALRVPPLRAGLAIAGASAIWYGTVSYLGFTLGDNWQRVMQLVTEYGRVLAVTAIGLLSLASILWLTRGRRISKS